MSNSEKFDKLFKEFDSETQKKANNYKIEFDGQSDQKNGYIGLKKCVNDLSEKNYSPYRDNYDFIDFCIKIRNIKFHSNDDIYFYLTDEAINKFESIVEMVKHPFTLESKCIKNVYYATLNSKVKDIMNEMNDKSYTHIPIYSDDSRSCLVGIFSEYSLYDFLMKNDFICIEDNTTFNQIKECIAPNNSKERVMFKARNSLYDDVVNEFIKEYKKKSRLECIMVTHSGSEKECVIGILTIWDIIGMR